MDKVSDSDEMVGLDPGRIKAAISESVYDPAQIAEKLGKSVDLVYRWQQGKRSPRLPELRALASLTRRPLEYFFGDEAPGPPPVTPEMALAVMGEAVKAAREADQLRDNLVRLSIAVRASAPAVTWPPEIQAILDKYPDDPKASRVATWEKSWNMGPIKPHTERAELAAREIKKKRKKKGDE